MRFARTATGLMLALVGLVVSVAGALAAFWLVGPDDTVHTGDQRLSGTGLAVVTAPGLLSRHGPVLEVTATGTDRPVFVGVGRDLDVSSYLAGSAHDRLVRFGLPVSFDSQQLRGETAKLVAPEQLDWWVAGAAGNGSQSIRWPMTDGRYSVVVMNADGTPAVDATVDFGFEVAGAFGAGLVVFGLGLVALAGGCALALSRRKQPEPVRVLAPTPTEGLATAPAEVPATAPAGTAAALRPSSAPLQPSPLGRLTAPTPTPFPAQAPTSLVRPSASTVGAQSVPGPADNPSPARSGSPVPRELEPAVSREEEPLVARTATDGAAGGSSIRGAGPAVQGTAGPAVQGTGGAAEREAAGRVVQESTGPVVRETAGGGESVERESERVAAPAIRYHPASRYLLTAHQNLVEPGGGLLLKERQATDQAGAEPSAERGGAEASIEQADAGLSVEQAGVESLGEQAVGGSVEPVAQPVSESEYQAQLRKTAALLASGAVLLSATGCVAAPERNTSRPDVRPAITLADGLALVRKYNEITNKANATRDAQLSATVQADPTLTQTRAGFRVRRVLDKEAQPKPFTSTEPQIGAPDFAGYPMRFVVSAGVSGAPDTRQLAVWERREAGTPWVLTHSVYPGSSAKVPSMQGLQVPTDSDLAELAVRPGVAAESLAAYLTGGAKTPQAKKFAPSTGAVELLAERARSAAADTAEAYIARVTDTFSVSGEPVTFLTANGEGLVFLALSERYLQRVEPGTSAYWTTGAATAFSNRIKYVKSLHQDYLHQVALVIPTRHTAGPVRILSIDGQLVNAGGT